MCVCFIEVLGFCHKLPTSNSLAIFIITLYRLLKVTPIYRANSCGGVKSEKGIAIVNLYVIIFEPVLY